MFSRRKIREIAMQTLFSMDIKKELKIEDALYFWEYFGYKNEEINFFKEIIEGVIENKEVIDRSIEEISKNWKMKRMPFVDRNIIRIAVFEILYREDIPNNVSINEAIDIVKKFGTRKSGAFVNGILDKIHSNSKDIK